MDDASSHKDMSSYYSHPQAKHMIMLKDVIGQEIIQFLEHCEGKV